MDELKQIDQILLEIGLEYRQLILKEMREAQNDDSNGD
jgi:hypothetical protein